MMLCMLLDIVMIQKESKPPETPIHWYMIEPKKRTSQWLLTRLSTLYDMATMLVVILLVMAGK